MSIHGTISFKNHDGLTYDFKIYPLDAAFKPEHGAVYIITARHDEAKHHHGHHIVFIGEAADMAVEMADHPSKSLFEAEKANCCCVHAMQDAASRKLIAEELSAKYLKS